MGIRINLRSNNLAIYEAATRKMAESYQIKRQHLDILERQLMAILPQIPANSFCPVDFLNQLLECSRNDKLVLFSDCRIKIAKEIIVHPEAENENTISMESIQDLQGKIREFCLTITIMDNNDPKACYIIELMLEIGNPISQRIGLLADMRNLICKALIVASANWNIGSMFRGDDLAH